MKKLPRVLLKMLAASAVLTVLFASAAMAGELDQDYRDESQSCALLDAQHHVAQTFTAGLTGQMDMASVYVHTAGHLPFAPYSGPLNVEVRNVEYVGVNSVGKPGETVLGRGEYNLAATEQTYEWIDIPLQEKAPVRAGTQYALVFPGFVPEVGDGAMRLCFYQKQPFHTSGIGYTRDMVNSPTWSDVGLDFAFQTYVTPDTVKPTGTILINNGAARTTTRLVTLNLSASDEQGGSGVTEMRFKNGAPDTAWSAWEPYAETKSWRLASGEGKKRVAVQYRDAAGNRSTPVYDYIIFRR